MCCQFDVPSNTSLSTYICVMFVSFKITYIHTYIHTYILISLLQASKASDVAQTLGTTRQVLYIHTLHLLKLDGIIFIFTQADFPRVCITARIYLQKSLVPDPGSVVFKHQVTALALLSKRVSKRLCTSHWRNHISQMPLANLSPHTQSDRAAAARNSSARDRS